jgi:hypothetical protein
MGTVYRRSYKDKRTGKLKRIRRYTLKFRDAAGRWVTEPAGTASKTVALRLLAERELAITGRTSVPGDRGLGREADLGLGGLRDGYLAALALRRKPSICRLYTERLDFTLRHLGVERPDGLDPARIDDYVRRRLAERLSPRTDNQCAPGSCQGRVVRVKSRGGPGGGDEH